MESLCLKNIMHTDGYGVRACIHFWAAQGGLPSLYRIHWSNLFGSFSNCLTRNRNAFNVLYYNWQQSIEKIADIFHFVADPNGAKHRMEVGWQRSRVRGFTESKSARMPTQSGRKGPVCKMRRAPFDEKGCKWNGKVKWCEVQTNNLFKFSFNLLDFGNIHFIFHSVERYGVTLCVRA